MCVCVFRYCPLFFSVFMTSCLCFIVHLKIIGSKTTQEGSDGNNFIALLRSDIYYFLCFFYVKSIYINLELSCSYLMCCVKQKNHFSKSKYPAHRREPVSSECRHTTLQPVFRQKHMRKIIVGMKAWQSGHEAGLRSDPDTAPDNICIS